MAGPLALMEAFTRWIIKYVADGDEALATRTLAMPLEKQVQILTMRLNSISLTSGHIHQLLLEHNLMTEEDAKRDMLSTIAVSLDKFEEKLRTTQAKLDSVVQKLADQGIDADGHNLATVIRSKTDAIVRANARITSLGDLNADVTKRCEGLEHKLRAFEQEEMENVVFRQANADLLKRSEQFEKQRNTAIEENALAGQCAAELNERCELLQKEIQAMKSRQAETKILERRDSELAARCEDLKRELEAIRGSNIRNTAANEERHDYLVHRCEKLEKLLGSSDTSAPAVVNLLSSLQQDAPDSWRQRASRLDMASVDDICADITEDIKSQVGGESTPQNTLPLRIRTYVGSCQSAFSLGVELWKEFPKALERLQDIRQLIKKEAHTTISSEEVEGILGFTALCAKYPLLLKSRIPFRSMVQVITPLLMRDFDSDQFGRGFQSQEQP